MTAKFNVGDEIICKIKDSEIVNVYISEHDREQIFEIIYVIDDNFLIYIPTDINIKLSIKVDKRILNKYKLGNQFLDDYVIEINEFKIFRVHKKIDGKRCNRCDNFFDMAEANQEDGSFKCFLCRTYKWR